MKAIKDGNDIRIEDGYLYKESIKGITGWRYDAAVKAWFAPCSEKNASLLQMLGAELDAELAALVEPVYNIVAADEIPLIRMPIRASPYKHQVRAFNFALRLWGITGSLRGGDEKNVSKE